jgi:hypothetical protein
MKELTAEDAEMNLSEAKANYYHLQVVPRKLGQRRR